MRWLRRLFAEGDSRDEVWQGPIEYVSLLDATWQGEPEWGDDAWVATNASDLAYDGPPFPGVLVRVGAAEGESVRVALSDGVPEWASLRVASSELVVSDHGFLLEAGDHARDVPASAGTYPVEVWVQPVEPGRATAVAFVIGRPEPRRLGTPRL